MVHKDDKDLIILDKINWKKNYYNFLLSCITVQGYQLCHCRSSSDVECSTFESNKKEKYKILYILLPSFNL